MATRAPDSLPPSPPKSLEMNNSNTYRRVHYSISPRQVEGRVQDIWAFSRIAGFRLFNSCFGNFSAGSRNCSLRGPHPLHPVTKQHVFLPVYHVEVVQPESKASRLTVSWLTPGKVQRHQVQEHKRHIAFFPSADTNEV